MWNEVILCLMMGYNEYIPLLIGQMNVPNSIVISANYSMHEIDTLPYKT